MIVVILAGLLLPTFNSLAGKQLSLPVGQPFFWAMVAGLLLLTGLTAGSYPALFLSSLHPIRVLKGSLKVGWLAIAFRKGLVVFQFVLSMIFLVGTIVIYQQMQYVQTKNLGYDRENLLYLPIEGELVKKYSLFKEEASKLPGILSISRMRHSPTVIDHSTSDIRWVGKEPSQLTSFSDELVGYDFVKTMKLKVLQGRDFSKDFATDSMHYLINETAAKQMGYSQPIGQPLWWGESQGRIIGILQDFHFSSMHEKIEPLIMRLDEKRAYGTILVRTQAGKTKEALSNLEKVCKAFNSKY